MANEIKDWDMSVQQQKSSSHQSSSNQHSQKLFKTLDLNKYRGSMPENASASDNWKIKYQSLSNQLELKEQLISELRSYQQILLEQLNQQPNLSSYINVNEYKLKNQKLLDQIDQLENEVKSKEDRLHSEILNQGELQKENMYLKQRFLQLEQQLLQKTNGEAHKMVEDLTHQLSELTIRNKKQSKFVRSVVDLVNSCYPKQYFGDTQPSLKTCWTWLKSILQEYIQIKGGTQRK